MRVCGVCVVCVCTNMSEGKREEAKEVREKKRGWKSCDFTSFSSENEKS